MRINGKLLALFASLGGDHKSAMPALAHALVSGNRLEATDLHVSLSVVLDDAGDDAEETHIAVPLDWLQQVGRVAGKKADVVLRHDAAGVNVAVRATWPDGGNVQSAGNRRSLGTYGMVAEDFPVVDHPAVASQAWRELAVVDWSKGGAVACAAPFASADQTRPHICGLRIVGRDVQATDEHKLACHVLATDAFAGVDKILPNTAVKMILKLVDATAPRSLNVSFGMTGVNNVTSVAWFTAQCVDYQWTVCTTLLDGASFPPIGKVVDELDKLSACASIPVADLRDLWKPFGKHCKLAIYRDGSVTAWGEPEEGIGTSLTAYAEPVITLGMDNLLPVLGALPKGGVVGMRYDQTDRTNAVILLGAVIMPMVVDMKRVAAELKETFGYVEPVVKESQQVA